ncbi:diguanylate cyclase [bacterium]|nr:diguanylate cyclase [bacterium]
MFQNESLYKDILENLYDGVYMVDTHRKILFWNGTAETITGYTKEEISNSYCWDNLLRHIDQDGNSLCRNDCPLSKTIVDGERREADVILHHKDGHRVPVSIRIAPIKNEKGEILGAIEIFNENSTRTHLIETLEELKEMALLDPLTHIANRRYIEQVLDTKLNELKRNQWPFGILFIDIDHFKRINDTHGHPIGDQVIKMVSSTLTANSRSIDVVGRWGGEEFIVVLSNVTKERIQDIAERLRIFVEHSGLEVDDESIQVTVSIGGTIAVPNDTMDSIIQRADECMYHSKENGRNQVTLKI